MKITRAFTKLVVIHSCQCWALSKMTVLPSKQLPVPETCLELWALGDGPSEEVWSEWVGA